MPLLLCVLCAACVIPTSVPKAPNIAEAQEQSEIYYDIWDRDFELTLSRLPSSGQASHIPYSGYWYPENKGGTNVSITGESALTKYDRAFNDASFPAVQWEVRHHNDKSRNWVGHCNGFASAAQRHAEPRQGVVRNGVSFTAADVKALLAEIYQHAQIKILGGRRCNSAHISETVLEHSGGSYCPQGYAPYTVTEASGVQHLKCIANKPNRTVSELLGACEDVNAGTFHLAITNWVGRRKQSIIFDKEVYNQVWNYPIQGYRITESRYLSHQEAVAMILPWAGQGGYPFNRAATRFYFVRMDMYYSDVHDDHERIFQLKTATQTYTYILELDSLGKIIGGEWTAQSYDSHPDFLWVAIAPVPTLKEDQARTALGISNPTALYQYMRNKSNPYVSIENVLDMWTESAGLPKDTRPPLLTSTIAGSWGQFPFFSLLLDGDTNGTVFLGKKVHLDVVFSNASMKRDLQVRLNGRSEKLNYESNAEVGYVLSPHVGVNNLVISLDGGKSEKVKFFAIPL